MLLIVPLPCYGKRSSEMSKAPTFAPAALELASLTSICTILLYLALGVPARIGGWHVGLIHDANAASFAANQSFKATHFPS